MDGDGEDHLSALSNDLLRHILHLVPFKEAASTSVLSRRWGSLWCSSGAVNLTVRVTSSPHQSYQEAQAAFVRAAVAALAAAESPVTRFTLRVDTDCDDNAIEQFLHSDLCPGVGVYVPTDVFSHPVAHRADVF
ncbi:unnamed protein product [Urochloa humidicola]